MARVQKIDNAVLKRFARISKKSKPKQMKVFFLIVCEGEQTEPNYFRCFDGQCGNVIFDVECQGEGKNTLQVVKQAIKLKDRNPGKYDRVWAVFDKDSFPDKNFNAAIREAEANNIGCAWSNQAFELWYLLHFLYRDTSMDRTEYQKAIEAEVNKKWKDKKKPYEYKKNATDMYDVLQKYGDQAQAIMRAESLSGTYNDEKFASHNPRTQVYNLVRQLIGKDHKLNDEIKGLIK